MIGKRGKYRYIRFGRIIMNFRRKNMLNICLRKNKAEVVSMSLFEYDEKHERMMMEIGREEGQAIGWKKLYSC